MGKTRAIKVRCIENGEVYYSYNEAGRNLGVSPNSIRLVVIGKQESTKALHLEAVEENDQEGGIVPSIVQNEQGEPIPVIDSREVARMMGREHGDILCYIEGKAIGNHQIIGILPTLLSNGFDPRAYFIESSYIADNGVSYRCYLCTRMGCELLATRQTKEKGILFCAKYVERFNAMEKELNSKSVHQYPEITEKQQCILAIYDGGASAVTASKRLVEIEVQEATAPLKGTIAEQQAELTQSKAELNEKTEFIDDINDCFTFYEVKEYNKQLLRDRKDIVLSTAELNKTAAELNMPVNKIDNPREYSPYRRVNAYPRKVWMTAYPDIKLPEKKSKKLPENESKKLPEKESK